MTSDPSDVEAPWTCTTCGAAMSASDVLVLENKLALQMRDALDYSLEHLEDQVQELETLLHRNHYLLLLGKRHLVGAYGIDLEKKPTEILERRKILCEQVRHKRVTLRFRTIISNKPVFL